jgi:predicted MFS family arabinose efflux permease
MPAAFALMANAHGPETRSKAIALFATSQLVGVAFGGSLGGFIAERFRWRASFWILGALGLLYAAPLYLFLRRLPAEIRLPAAGTPPARMADFFRLLRIPSLQVVSAFVAVATFGLYLVYTWLPTFLYDKFHLGLELSGREAALYPQAGTLAGLFFGGIASEPWRKTNPAARFWLVFIAFGFCSSMIIANQAPSAFDVVPATYRATAAGILNLVGCLVSGFAPYLGGLARGAIGIDQLMAATGACYLLMAALIAYAALRLVPRDAAA